MREKAVPMPSEQDLIEAQLAGCRVARQQAEKRVAELEAALRCYADDIERVYGHLPVTHYPGPPTSIVANMRNIAAKTN